MFDPVPDQEQRLQALDHTQSFIVQAPAGSGKTELLIQRFLALLARVDQPEAVVAITFTRKAAAEMRHRIIAALQSVAGPEPATPHEQHTRKLAQEALTQNDRLNWHLTEHPARLRIQTIDSLCAMLVRQMPWISRMGGRSTRKRIPGICTVRRHAKHWPCWILRRRRRKYPGRWQNFFHTWTTMWERWSGY